MEVPGSREDSSFVIAWALALCGGISGHGTPCPYSAIS